MLLNKRPIPATVGGAPADKRFSDKKKEFFTYSNSAADDFNSFSSAPKKQRKKPSEFFKRDFTFEINPRSLIIAAVSLLAAIVLIVLVSTVIATASKNVKYDDNTYLCYQDADKNYVIVKNGKPIRDVFADETSLRPAADNSFAYVTVKTAEGYDVYVLEGARPKLICDNAEKIQAYADFEAALVYVKEGRSVYFYDGAESVITTGTGTASNVVISPDATAVIYNAPSKSNPEISALFVYTTASETAEQMSSGTVVPVSVSNKGKYILAYTEAENKVRSLSVVLEGKKAYPISGLNGSFEEVIYKNSDDTEIIFTTKDESGANHTYLFDCRKLSTRKANTAYYLGTGKSIPQLTDERIVRLDTVKKCYFRNVAEGKTFYLNGRFKPVKVSDFVGEFDPDLDYFYFVNTQKKILCKMEIRNGKSKSITPVAYDVEEFAVTEKGNVYYLDRYFDFYFYKLSQNKSTRIASDVEKMEFYKYKNVLYFETEDENGEECVCMTTEGSTPEIVKLAKDAVASVLSLTNGYSKNTYAIIEDDDIFTIYYTANGRTFKKVATTEKLITK